LRTIGDEILILLEHNHSIIKIGFAFLQLEQDHLKDRYIRRNQDEWRLQKQLKRQEDELRRKSEAEAPQNVEEDVSEGEDPKNITQGDRRSIREDSLSKSEASSVEDIDSGVAAMSDSSDDDA
jgi:hypothetical protein